jgi:hypothetical protein
MKHHLFFVLYNIFSKKKCKENFFNRKMKTRKKKLYEENKFIVTHISSVKNKKIIFKKNKEKK